MEFNDNIDYAEVFGEDVSAVAEGSAEADEGNAGDTSVDDASVGESVEDASVDAASGEDSAESSENGGENAAEGGERAERPTQSAEDNSRFAAARREAERQRDAAIAAEREASRKALEEVFAGLGIINPYTGNPIRTKEEYDAYRASHDEEQKKSFMQTHNMDEAAYNSMLNNLPEVREAREVTERARIAEVEARREGAKARLDEQIREIGKLDPAIKSADDLIKDPSYKDVFAKVKQGYTVLDAYRTVNFEKLTKNASAAARQQVINNQSGKEHLTQTTQRGTGIDMVPADVRQTYRDLNPDMSDAEIAREYAKYLNQTRKK